MRSSAKYPRCRDSRECEFRALHPVVTPSQSLVIMIHKRYSTEKEPSQRTRMLLYLDHDSLSQRASASLVVTAIKRKVGLELLTCNVPATYGKLHVSNS